MNSNKPNANFSNKNYQLHASKKYWLMVGTGVAAMGLFLAYSDTVKASTTFETINSSNPISAKDGSSNSIEVFLKGRLVVNYVDTDPNHTDETQKFLDTLKIDREERAGQGLSFNPVIPKGYVAVNPGAIKYNIGFRETTTLTIYLDHQKTFNKPQIMSLVKFSVGSTPDDFLSSLHGSQCRIFWGSVIDEATGQKKYAPYEDIDGRVRLYSIPNWSIPFDSDYKYSVDNGDFIINDQTAEIVPNTILLDDQGLADNLPVILTELTLNVAKKETETTPEPEVDPTPDPEVEEKPEIKPEPETKPDVPDNQGTHPDTEVPETKPVQPMAKPRPGKKNTGSLLSEYLTSEPKKVRTYKKSLPKTRTNTKNQDDAPKIIISKSENKNEVEGYDTILKIDPNLEKKKIKNKVEQNIAMNDNSQQAIANLGSGNDFSQLGLYFTSLSGIVNFGVRA